MPNVHEIIRDHVRLSISCIDRLYVNGYLPALQTPEQVRYFLEYHLGNPVPSPALFRPIHDRFVGAVKAHAERQHISLVAFERGQRKDDVVAGYRTQFRSRQGVVLIGVAQERAWSFKGSKQNRPTGGFTFGFTRQTVAVNHYYFYVQDLDWGPAFLKVGSYAPYPVKLCLNGHEWVKRQLRRQRIRFEALDNGLLSCRQPERVQQICDELGPEQVQAFFDRWSRRLPWPLTAEDRAAGYEHRLSLWQIEVSLTQVFDRPVQGRHFFEEIIRDNLDLGRPDRIRLLFPKRITRSTPPPPRGWATRVLIRGVDPSLHIDYKRSHVKQYFKEQRALRTETTINNPYDFGTSKALRNLPYLRRLANGVNRKLLELERVSHNCALSQDALDRLQQPTVEQGQRASALRFGDSRVMALLHALCRFHPVQHGFRNRDLRQHVASLIGPSLDRYTPGRMTYDLRRLRLKGLISRQPGTHRYAVTTYGLRVALFCSKLYLRILRPAWAALIDSPDPVPRPLRKALTSLEDQIHKLCDRARLQPVA
jgi:hypothetical protein